MNNDQLIGMINMDCPLCNKTHSLEQRKRHTQSIVKDEVVDFDEIYFFCPLSDEEENEFVTAGLMDGNLLRGRDSYRMKKGLLTSAEIANIRNYYGLSQSDFSAILGWGEVTITRYESKTIQDETYDNIMRMAYENPMFALESLEKHKNRFPLEKYVRLRKNIAVRVAEIGNSHLLVQEIRSLYVDFSEEDEQNGYKLLDLEKVANVMGHFSGVIENLYKIKLMKLLWYSDALFYGRQGRSMTGLVYKHMPLGALPIGYNEIICLPTVKIEEELIYDDISYRIKSTHAVDPSVFTPEELEVLEAVVKKFKPFNTREILEYMHNEPAYTETISNQIIPYSLANQLKDLK